MAWYHPCEAASLDRTIRVACGVPHERQYLLLEAETQAGVAVSSSLPSGSIFELAILPPPNAKVAVLLIDPVSTGAVLCHQLVTRRDASVIVVYSDAL